MKIALVTMQLGPDYPHGTERYIESLASELRDRGHRVLLLAGDPMQSGERPFGAPRGGEQQILHHPTSGWLTVEGAVDDAGAWLAREHPDVVHLANPAHIGTAVALAAEPLGIPVVATAMDFWWICPRATLLRNGSEHCDGAPGWRDCLRCVSRDHPRRALRALAFVPNAFADASLAVYSAAAAARRSGQRSGQKEAALWKHRRTSLGDLLNRLDAVIFPSPATRDAIGRGLTHDRTWLVPYGLAPEWFEEPRPRRVSGGVPAPEELTLGYAGSLSEHKAPHLLLEAVRLLGWHRTRVRIAGALDRSTPYGRRLERAARGLEVEFTGLLGRREMRAFHCSLDVLAVTSVWAENLPFVMLEGLASGTTVVASNVGGIADCIDNRELLFAAGDARDLARALSIAREAAPAATGPPAVSTLAAMTDATLEIYERSIERRGRAVTSRP